MSIETLPKAELHVHLEGSAPPSLIKKLAARNGLPIPKHIFASDTCFAWRDFSDFMATYDKACSVIRKPKDYYDITYAYLKNSAKQNAWYVEMIYSPLHAEINSGMPSHEHLIAIHQAICDAQQQYGIEGRIIVTCVRHYGLASALKVAKHAAEASIHSVVGLHLSGDEVAFPPGQFAPAYNIAHEAGLACTVHAGEFVGPSGIREALDTLPITRLGHGVRAIEERGLIELLREKNIALEVCPTSNIKLNVYTEYDKHPLRRLFDAGIALSLNSDDPPYFDTDLGQEYKIAHDKFGFSELELLHVTKSAIMHSFADERTKKHLLKRLKAYKETEGNMEK